MIGLAYGYVSASTGLGDLFVNSPTRSFASARKRDKVLIFYKRKMLLKLKSMLLYRLTANEQILNFKSVNGLD